MKKTIFLLIPILITIVHSTQGMEINSEDKSLKAVYQIWNQYASETEKHIDRIGQLLYEAKCLPSGSNLDYIIGQYRIACINALKKTITTYVGSAQNSVCLSYDTFLKLFGKQVEDQDSGTPPDASLRIPAFLMNTLKEANLADKFMNELMILSHEQLQSFQASESALIEFINTFIRNNTHAKSEEITKSCTYCGEKNCPTKCGKCKKSYYCSRECQGSDWPTHKAQCKSSK